MADSGSVTDSDEQHVLRVFFLDGSFREVEISDDTNIGQVHERLAAQLRQTDSVSPRDPLLAEFALFKHIGSPAIEHYILPEYLVFPVVESFEEIDKICFQRLIFPIPQPDIPLEMIDTPTGADRDRDRDRQSSSSSKGQLTSTPPITDSESGSPRNALSSSVQILPSESTASIILHHHNTHDRSGSGSGSAHHSHIGINTGSMPSSPSAPALSHSSPESLGLSSPSHRDPSVGSRSAIANSAGSTGPGSPSISSSSGPVPASGSPTQDSPNSGGRKSPRSRSRSLSSVPALKGVASGSRASPRNSPRQESPRISSYKFSIASDPTIRWLDYCECIHIFQSQNLFKPFLKEIIEIGALDLLIKSKRENISTKTLLKMRHTEFVPERFVTASKSHAGIEQVLTTFAEIKALSIDSAMQELIQLVYKWRYYGTCVFFDCKPSDKRISSKAVIVGVNEDGIILMKKDGDVISIHPYSTIASWSAAFTSFQFESTAESKDDSPQIISLETQQGETIGVVVSAIVDRKLRILLDSIRQAGTSLSSLADEPQPASPRGSGSGRRD